MVICSVYKTFHKTYVCARFSCFLETEKAKLNSTPTENQMLQSCTDCFLGRRKRALKPYYQIINELKKNFFNTIEDEYKLINEKIAIIAE